MEGALFILSEELQDRQEVIDGIMKGFPILLIQEKESDFEFWMIDDGHFFIHFFQILKSEFLDPNPIV